MRKLFIPRSHQSKAKNNNNNNNICGQPQQQKEENKTTKKQNPTRSKTRTATPTKKSVGGKIKC